MTDTRLCSSCRLELEHVAALGRLSDPELVDEGAPSVQHDSGGRFLVASTTPRTKILVYDSLGAYVRSWGRRGAGPREFRNISQIAVVPGDSLLVVDPGNLRISIADSRGRVARSFQLPIRPLDVVRLPSLELVVSASYPGADRNGQPLHRIAPDGRLLGSFGNNVPVRPSRPSEAQRWVAHDRRGGVWAVRPDRYEIERWTITGERLSTIDRVVEWFPDREVEGAVNFLRERPHPWVQDLHVDAGRLWVLARVAAANWAPVEERVYRPAWSRFFDTVVEVIDPSDGTLLASRRFPWYGDTFTNDGLIVSHREGEGGIMVLDVWRAGVVRFASP